MRPIVAAPTGVAKADRLSMGGGARRFFEGAKRRISIDKRCITSNNSIELHSAAGAGLAIQARLSEARRRRACRFRFSERRLNRATSARVRPPPSPSAVGKKGPPPINALGAVHFIDKFRNSSIQFPVVISRATRLVRGKETCAGRIVAEGKRTSGGRALRTTSDAS